MISGVTVQVEGEAETLRMTTRAMIAIEQHFDKGLVEVLDGMKDGLKIGDLAFLISQCADDGAGVDMDRAGGIIDAISVPEAAEVLSKVAEAAFANSKGAPAKNAKRVARSK